MLAKQLSFSLLSIEVDLSTIWKHVLVIVRWTYHILRILLFSVGLLGGLQFINLTHTSFVKSQKYAFTQSIKALLSPTIISFMWLYLVFFTKC